MLGWFRAEAACASRGNVPEPAGRSPLRQAGTSGNKPAKPCVLRLVDDTHSSAAELLDDPVVRNGLADHRPESYVDEMLVVDTKPTSCHVLPGKRSWWIGPLFLHSTLCALLVNKQLCRSETKISTDSQLLERNGFQGQETPIHSPSTLLSGEKKSGSIAEFVGKRAVEKAATWKSPEAGLSHYAWKSRKSGGISTFPTAPATTVRIGHPNLEKKNS